MTELGAHQAAVRDAVLEGLALTPSVGTFELGQLKIRLARSLRPRAAGQDGPGVEIHLDSFRLPTALRRSETGPREAFEWNAPRAARSLGLPAVATLWRNPGVGLGSAVEGSVQSAVSDAKSLGLWLAELDSPERAMVVAQARSWAARAWLAVPWSSFERVQFRADAVWFRPLGPGTPMVMRARRDATVRTRGPRGVEHVLVTLGPPDPSVARFNALVVGLVSGRAPLRTVVVDPSSGSIEVADVGADLLHRAVEEAVRAISWISGLETGRSSGRSGANTDDLGWD
ncbi:MAG: hypothetical protein ACYDAD_12990 [Acidimicrobiales bacterium]